MNLLSHNKKLSNKLYFIATGQKLEKELYISQYLQIMKGLNVGKG